MCPCQLTLVLHDIGAGQHGIQRVKVLRRKFPQEQAFRFKLSSFCTHQQEAVNAALDAAVLFQNSLGAQQIIHAAVH